jgi:hypothetical protein
MVQVPLIGIAEADSVVLVLLLLLLLLLAVLAALFEFAYGNVAAFVADQFRDLLLLAHTDIQATVGPVQGKGGELCDDVNDDVEDGVDARQHARLLLLLLLKGEDDDVDNWFVDGVEHDDNDEVGRNGEQLPRRLLLRGTVVPAHLVDA